MKEYKSLDNLLLVSRISVLLVASAHSIYFLLFYFCDIEILAKFKLAEALVAWVFAAVAWRITNRLNLIIYYVRASLIFSCIVCNQILGVDYGFISMLVLIVAVGYMHNFKRAWVPIALGVAEVITVILAAIFSFNVPTYESDYKDFINAFGLIFAACGVFFYALITEQVSTFTQRKLDESKQNQRKNLETDKLSGLYNRTTMNEILLRQVELASQTQGAKLYVALLDCDNFRKINEIYGHRFGDLAIINISNIIKNAISQKDDSVYAGRWSGQEFLISTIETNESEFIALLERIRKEVAECTHTDGYHSGSICLSIGVCISRLENISTILAKADSALYESKRAGGNKLTKISLKDEA